MTRRVIPPGHAMSRLRALTETSDWALADLGEMREMLRAYMGELRAHDADSRGSETQGPNTLNPDTLNPDTLKEYPYLSTYWSFPTRLALRMTGPATHGFVLLLEDTDPLDGQTAVEIREFYVQPPYRCSGVGRRAVRSLLAAWQGRWQLEVLRNNTAAIRFWQAVLSDRLVSITETAKHYQFSIDGCMGRPK